MAWSRTSITTFNWTKSQFPWSYYHLGDALARQQKWQKATEAYRYFLTREANAYAYERLGDNLIKQAQPFSVEAKSLREEARQCYYRAIEVDRDYLQPYYKLLELKPYAPEVYFLLAETYARQEEWATAIIFYQIGLQIDSNFPEVHFELGMSSNNSNNSMMRSFIISRSKF